ncbi:hypothetical protein LSH36_324g02018 [Paralvinella palmiformis]|uniref:Uncharacterized protein n=1 Tax=Paralvinella palmiformis TaxID=53620 RepID=A0AAD9JGA4_9ANNE|nr:hypothetical protein LSH36_324g02018 [Paralvinella palmiformis]
MKYPTGNVVIQTQTKFCETVQHQLCYGSATYNYYMYLKNHIILCCVFSEKNGDYNVIDMLMCAMLWIYISYRSSRLVFDILAWLW